MSDKRRDEIERLKNRIKELEKEIGEGNPKKDVSKKKSKKYVKVLVTLVVILLVVDIVSIFGYYKPDLNIKFVTISNASSKSTGVSGQKGTQISTTKKSTTPGKCEDGTVEGSCSKDKPYYCYNGELLKKAATCGCPTGYKLAFQDCVKPVVNDSS